MKTYLLYLESGPRRKKTMVHVLDLPGCIAKGPTTDEALAATPDAIRAYLRFLQRHGDQVDLETDFRTEIAEHVTEGYFLGSGSQVIIFKPDLEPLTTPEIETGLKWLEWLRADVLSLYNGLASDQAQARTEEKQRSIREILQHLLETERFFLWAIFGKVATVEEAVKRIQKGDGDLLDWMQRARQATLERIRATTPDHRAQIVKHGKETWTLRKSVRRMLEHEWEHLLEIAERLGQPPG